VPFVATFIFEKQSKLESQPLTLL